MSFLVPDWMVHDRAPQIFEEATIYPKRITTKYSEVEEDDLYH